MTVYVLDTNVISDIAAPNPNTNVLSHLAAHQQDTLCLCEAVDYEVRRGYLKAGAVARLRAYDQLVKLQFHWLQLTPDDWMLAAQLWADAANKGRVLSDIDLLIAAISQRLDAVIVTADDDFNALPVNSVNWRVP